MFHFRDKTTFIALYIRYVRCHLEFAGPVWSPWTKQDIEVLEKVQKRAIRAVSGLQGSYEDKLMALGIQSLENRRIRQDMIQTFKIIHSVEDVNPTHWFQLASDHSTRETRQSTDPYNILPKAAKTEIRRNFFSCRVVNEWNKLPASVKNAPSVNTFKALYDKL